MWCSVILYGAKLIACVTQPCPHLAEKCKLRIKTKHGKIYLGKTTDFRRVEYAEREDWHKMNFCTLKIHLKIKYMFCLKDKCVGFISHNHRAGKPATMNYCDMLGDV